MATKNIEPNLRLISEYCKLDSDDVFCIPNYQRSYSWTVENCAKLLQDINEFMLSKSADPYFFGTIIIDCHDDHHFNLIDGQQRTTSFLLLLKALQLRIKSYMKTLRNCPDEDAEALYEGLKESYNTILRILYKADVEERIAINKDWRNAHGIDVLKNDSISELHKDDLQIIIEAETFDEAERNVYKEPRRQKDNKYTHFFRNFKFFYDTVDKDEEGKSSESHLNTFAKTFLNKCQVIEIRSWMLEQAIAMFNSLNSTGLPLTDADIISAQLYSKAADKDDFNARWKAIIETADELGKRRIVSIDSVLQQYMYIRRAADGEYSNNEVTTPGVRKYYLEIHKKWLDAPIDLCKDFQKILDIWECIKDKPIVKLLLKFNENARLFLISYLFYRYSDGDISDERIAAIATPLLRLFALEEVSPIAFSSSLFKTFLFNANLRFVHADYADEQIVADFDRHIHERFAKEKVAEELSDYCKNVLVFLNDFLYANKHGLPFDFTETVNVEHIMPASGHNIESIRVDAGIEDKDEFNALVNTLGNKILLEEDINKHIGCDWFLTKKGCTVNSKKGYRNSKFALAVALSAYPKSNWKKEDIVAATQKVINRLLAFTFNEPQE